MGTVDWLAPKEAPIGLKPEALPPRVEALLREAKRDQLGRILPLKDCPAFIESFEEKLI